MPSEMESFGSMDLDAVKLMRHIKLTVTVKREREMKVRIWLAAKLVSLAGWVSGMKIVFVQGEDISSSDVPKIQWVK